MRRSIACLAVLVAAAGLATRGGPVMDENPAGLDRRRQEAAAQEWAASTNALTASNFVAMIEQARNFQDLKEALLAKARSDAGLEAALRRHKNGK